MAQPAKFDINLTAGDDFQITIKLLDNGDPIDTSSYVFKAQVRTGYLPDAPLIAEFGVLPVTGGATLSLTKTQTRAFSSGSKLFWDVQSESPDVRTWLSGRVFVTPEVTE